MAKEQPQENQDRTAAQNPVVTEDNSFPSSADTRRSVVPESDTKGSERADDDTQSARDAAEQASVSKRPTAVPTGNTDTISVSDLFSAPSSGSAIPSTRSPEQSESSRQAANDQLGDYQLLQKLGEGGMGVVFVARQLSADRVVALKVIRPDRLAVGDSAGIIQRFHTEARVAAKLEHDNIVTLFDVGESEGQHYFSMRLVNGSSIAEALRNGPLANRRAAKYLLGVSSGMAHAHQLGILHRDLKPQNILIDDASDRALITDFGLAKLLQSDDVELTRQGEVIGTPAYMSPEQAVNSGSVDQSADIYALGATLYHTITGRPPFQAATPLETLEQVIQRDPVSPRQLNPGIDKDLETICLKCLEKRPVQRYRSSREVADELERYLEGKPILARPLGPFRRLARRCQRHPVVAGLSVATIAATVVALAGLTFGILSARAAQNKAEASFDTTLVAVNQFYTRVSEEALLDQPGMRPFRRRLLKEALGFYQRLVRDFADHPRLGVEVARAHFRIGWITAQLESDEASLPHYERALAMQQTLANSKPTPQMEEQLSDTWNAIGIAHQRLGQYAQAEEGFQRALRIRRRLAAGNGAPDARRKQANSLMNLGILDGDRRKFDSAVQRFAAAQELREAIHSTVKDDWIDRDLGKGYFNWFDLLLRQQELEQVDNRASCVKQLSKATSRFEQLHQRNTVDQDAIYNYAVCLRSLGDLEPELKNATSRYSDALRVLRPLADQNNEVAPYQLELARLLVLLAETNFENGEFPECIRRLDDAIQRLQPFAKDSSNRQVAEVLQVAQAARAAAVSRQDGAQP